MSGAFLNLAKVAKNRMPPVAFALSTSLNYFLTIFQNKIVKKNGYSFLWPRGGEIMNCILRGDSVNVNEQFQNNKHPL